MKEKKQKRKHPLEGLWHSPDWSDVEFTIKRRGKTFSISAVDTYDGEKLKVSGVKWDGKELSFTLFTPSTKHVCKHVFRNLHRGQVDCELTYSVPCKKKRTRRK